MRIGSHGNWGELEGKEMGGNRKKYCCESLDLLWAGAVAQSHAPGGKQALPVSKQVLYFVASLLSPQLSRAEHFLPPLHNVGVTELSGKSVPIVYQGTPPFSIEVTLTDTQALSSFLITGSFACNTFRALHEHFTRVMSLSICYAGTFLAPCPSDAV